MERKWWHVGGTNILDADPKLGPLADNGGPTQTCAPGKGSSAIDAGTAEGAPPTDQRGVKRPQGGGIDIGAVEISPR
ncbi:MAG: choice-of-anchor Q domain-containing protein [Aminivibrio sp.]